ncbi:nuclear transport factor 2 family protein [Mycobacterium sp. 360MFTsu5.1]|uniref:nuclear transport factor 2 family protein n=1 Tax=Mycobacterium sp. 360MFTsu5.1 TaxID=1172186 RepID=UPI00036FD04E|nr:nuclear transport factor 2 family protein [Mycobacterium sp. 360MFTsu5.1]
MGNKEIPAGIATLLDGMHAGDMQKVAESLSEDIVLKSPIFADPFVGRERAVGVITHLLNVVDQFVPGEVLWGRNKFAALLKLTVGTADVEGVDVMTVNEEGKVNSMTIQWRPLPAVVEVQNRLAPAVGVPVLKLTPVT